jgi:hypothetical protein
MTERLQVQEDAWKNPVIVEATDLNRPKSPVPGVTSEPFAPQTSERMDSAGEVESPTPANRSTDFRRATATINPLPEPPNFLAPCTGLDASLDANLLTESGNETSNILPEEYVPHALTFAMEHRIFLKAALDLVAERDRRAPEVGMNDPFVLKSGPLKKASHLMNGVWKVKYVEIRRGMFSYYENASSKDTTRVGDLLRKNIPLEVSLCCCRAVKLHQKALNLTPNGAIFEMTFSGTRRLWMANSRAERQAWMQTINAAMVGGSLTRSDSVTNHSGALRGVSPRSPFKNDLRLYLRAQHLLRTAKSQSEYTPHLQEFSAHPLTVPVRWIAKQQQAALRNATGEEVAFREEAVNLSVEQLWRDLQRDSVLINGELFMGASGHGPEKMMGALTRELLTVSDEGRGELNESQAVAYARDILLSGNRTRSGGDSYFCANSLCRNCELAVVVPSAAIAEPVSITVSRDGTDVPESRIYSSVHDKSGWIKTRNKMQRTWRKLFFVLSEGTLSYYERAHPQPHRLRGQLVLTDGCISISRKQTKQDDKPTNQFVMSVTSKEGSVRILLFESEDRLLDWTYSLEYTAKARASEEIGKKGRRRSSHDIADGKADSIETAKSATKGHFDALGIDASFVIDRLALHEKKMAYTTLISIQASTEYKICTIDPQGDDQLDVWATLYTQFLQNFRVAGGPNSRIMRGEEVVRISIAAGIDTSHEVQEVPSGNPVLTTTANTPSSPRRSRKGRTYFRSFASNGDETEEVPKDS